MQCGSANLTSPGGANPARDLSYCPVALRTSVLPADALREKTQIRAPDCQLLNRDEWLAGA
jgi:hypothetical protein